MAAGVDDQRHLPGPGKVAMVAKPLKARKRDPPLGAGVAPADDGSALSAAPARRDRAPQRAGARSARPLRLPGRAQRG